MEITCTILSQHKLQL